MVEASSAQRNREVASMRRAGQPLGLRLYSRSPRHQGVWQRVFAATPAAAVMVDILSQRLPQPVALALAAAIGALSYVADTSRRRDAELGIQPKPTPQPPNAPPDHTEGPRNKGTSHE